MLTGTHIRPEHADNHAPIRDVLIAAFGQPAEANLVEALRADGSAVLGLVADCDGAVAGHILLSRLDAPMRALALAPLAMHPQWQHRGLGTALTEAAIAAAIAHSWDAIFVLGDPAYYRRFGFDAQAAAGYTTPYPGPHFMVRPLRTPLPRTGRIAYPPAFTALDG